MRTYFATCLLLATAQAAFNFTEYVIVRVDSNSSTIDVKTSTAWPSTLLTMKRNGSNTTNTTSNSHGVSSFPSFVTVPSVQATASKAVIGDVGATSNGSPASVPTGDATPPKNNHALAAALEAAPEPEYAPEAAADPEPEPEYAPQPVFEYAPAPEPTPQPVFEHAPAPELAADPEPAADLEPAADPEPAFGDSVYSSSDNNFALLMLHLHNIRRPLHNAHPLSWSSVLEGIAQNIANDYSCDGTLTHSGVPYGENLAYIWSAKDAFNMWYGESQFHHTFNTFDHFTQVIWQSTSEIGCAFKICSDNTYYNCLYTPQGNMLGEGEFNLVFK